jgi:hypothetical protein
MKPRFAFANQVAASHFDHAPLSFKVTTNPNTAERARKNQTKWTKKRVGRIPLEWMAGASIPLNKSGRKALLYIGKKNPMARAENQPTAIDQEMTAFHELFHGYFLRYRRAIGKKFSLLGSELAAHIAELDYMSKVDSEGYRKEIINPRLDFASIDSIFADGLAIVIHKEFGSVQRAKILDEIKNGDFSSRKAVIKWLVRLLQQKDSQSRYLLEFQRYLERK